MKNKQIRQHRWSKLPSGIVCAFLVIAIACATPGNAKACGFHTHAYIGQRATQILDQNFKQRYPDLVRILGTYHGWVEAGEVFPDWGMAGNISVPGCGQTCLDAGEIAHGNIKTSPNFQETITRELVAAFRSTPRTAETEQKIAFLLGVIGHNIQDKTFDGGLMAADMQVDSNDTHETIDSAVNAFTYVDLGARAIPAAWQYPYTAITAAYNLLDNPVPWEWLRDGSGLGLPAGLVVQEGAAVPYYPVARYFNHTWLYPNYIDYIPGGINDLINKTAVAWMQTWDWLSTYSPVTTVSLTPSNPDGQNGWYRQTIKMELAAGDNFDEQAGHIESGPLSTMFRINGEPYQTYTGPLTISEQGIHQISYYSVDSSENAETPHDMIIKVDITPPLVNVSTDKERYTKAETFTIHFSATDAHSGIANLSAEFNGQAVVNGQTVSLRELNGPYILTVSADDLAGNHMEASRTIEVTPVMIYLPFILH